MVLMMFCSLFMDENYVRYTLISHEYRLPGFFYNVHNLYQQEGNNWTTHKKKIQGAHRPTMKRRTRTDRRIMPREPVPMRKKADLLSCAAARKSAAPAAVCSTIAGENCFLRTSSHTSLPAYADFCVSCRLCVVEKRSVFSISIHLSLPPDSRGVSFNGSNLERLAREVLRRGQDNADVRLAKG